MILMRYLIIAGLAVFVLANPVLAQTEPSFSITPAKSEYTVSPGENKTATLTITNNLGRPVQFELGIEDLGTPDLPTEAVKLLGPNLGPYSLKPYLGLNSYAVTIPDQETRTVALTFKVPAGAPAGTRHGAVTVTARAAPGGAQVNAQLAALIFLRIPGLTTALGRVTDFGVLSDRIVWGRQPQFYFTFQNLGNIYLNPYGVIELSPRLALPGAMFPVPPNFVLPGGSRIREVGEPGINWRFAGWYEARLKLNRGYNNELDQLTTNLLIVPWWLVFAVSLLVLALVWRLVLKLRRRQPYA